MKNVFQARFACTVFMVILISGWLIACNKNHESPEITTFIKDLSTRVVGLAFDNQSNMFVGTIENQSVKKILRISPDAEVSTLISLECLAIEFIKAGNDDSLYVSVIVDNEEGGGKIYKITHDAKMSVVSEGFTQPVGIVFDLEDNLYVIDAMTKKIYKISPSKEKSIFIDLESISEVPQDNFYHGIDFDSGCRNLYIAGLNNSNKGNLLKFPIKADGNPDKPVMISDHYSKHVVIHNEAVYSTIDNNSILIVQEDQSQKIINNSLLTNGMNLSFGKKDFGENNLYVNTFDKIVKITW